MNLRKASNRLIALYYRRWLLIVAFGVPGVLLAGKLHESPHDPVWSFAGRVFVGLFVVSIATAFSWIVSGLFERELNS